MKVIVQCGTQNTVNNASENNIRVVSVENTEIVNTTHGSAAQKIIVDSSERAHVQLNNKADKIRVISTSPTTPQLALQNTSKITFLAGEVIGISKESGFVKAQAGIERGLMVCTANSAPNAILAHVSTGNCLALLEDGISAAPGDWAFLSTSQAGRITSISPESYSQNLGKIFGYPKDGMVVVQLHIDLEFAS